MNTLELENKLLETLKYTNSPHLLRGADVSWVSGRSIDEVKMTLQVKHIPVAYFSRFTELDLYKIQQLHKKVWSQSKVPLLFVTLPHEIRVYSGYEPTPQCVEDLDAPSRLLQKLDGLNDVLTAEREIKNQLLANKYERIYLETGAFWDTQEGRRVNANRRADKLLIDSLHKMRELLMGQGLSSHLAYTLLGRSIFIRYLEDRGVLTPSWIEELTAGLAKEYRDVLPDHGATYALFEALSKRFNGDLFPVEPEENQVETPHLELLLSFLGRTDLETGQLSLWPYNFEYIPIELISNIYDTFIENRRSSGAYYTPLLLADFILEETLGEDVVRPDMTILDPACGSGIFLVGAYRRLIQAWRKENGQPDRQGLSQILQDSIFGVDKEPEAVRIAAFSLYLEMLNHLSNAQIQDAAFKFPLLAQSNLVQSDFFDAEMDKKWADRKFDRVIGNMPWGKGTLSNKANRWLEEKKYTVGGKQAAPAFMLRVPEFCKEDGEIALLAPVKSTILVTSGTHQTFREDFFTRYDVRAVVNFAAMRHELFSSAINPVAALFYLPNPPAFNRRLVYAVPKPSPLSQRLRAIVLDTTEIKFLDLEELLEQAQLWKVAMWGNPRDAALIERLKTYPPLNKQFKRLGGAKPHEGFQVGESDNIERDKMRVPIPRYLKDRPFLQTEEFVPFFIATEKLSPTDEERVYNPGDERRFTAPMVLIHQSKCKAAYVDKNLSYLASFSGIKGEPGQEYLLKWLVCLINSSLAKYYQFLTSTRWAVERPNPLHTEYLDIPFLILDENNPSFQKILSHFEAISHLLSREESIFITQLQAQLEEHQKAINELVFELYGLHSIEQQLVEDMLDYGIEFFNWAKRKSRKPGGAKPVQRPDVEMLTAYAQVFNQVATSVLQLKQKTLNATVYQNGEPLTVISFDLVYNSEARPVHVIEEPTAMRTKLYQLNELALSQNTPSMFTRRHIRLYDGKQVSLIRPSEQRFWTQSQARADADAFVAELFA